MSEGRFSGVLLSLKFGSRPSWGEWMSQHFYRLERNGETTEVVLGFDGPIGHFFLTVSRGTKVIYSNLMEEEPFELGLPYFRQKLGDMGIALPESMFSEVEIDRLGNADRLVLHREDGSFQRL